MGWPMGSKVSASKKVPLLCLQGQKGYGAPRHPGTQCPRQGKATAGSGSAWLCLEEEPVSHLLTEASLQWSLGFQCL